MAKKRRHKKKPPATIDPNTLKGELPKGAQYNALKGMGYTPSRRDQHRKTRKQARQNLKRGDWD
jgi:hypothetical protein